MSTDTFETHYNLIELILERYKLGLDNPNFSRAPTPFSIQSKLSHFNSYLFFYIKIFFYTIIILLSWKYLFIVHSQKMLFSLKYVSKPRVLSFKIHVRATQFFFILHHLFHSLLLKNMRKFVYFHGQKLICVLNSLFVIK